MEKPHSSQKALQEVIRSQRVGDWKLTENIGRGGQGTTFRALWSKENKSLTQIALGVETQHRAVVKLMIPPSPTDFPIPRAVFPQFLETQVKHFVQECAEPPWV